MVKRSGWKEKLKEILRIIDFDADSKDKAHRREIFQNRSLYRLLLPLTPLTSHPGRGERKEVGCVRQGNGHPTKRGARGEMEWDGN